MALHRVRVLGQPGRHVIVHYKPGGRDVAFRHATRINAVNAAAVRAAAWPGR
jgi:hypothetical protein